MAIKSGNSVQPLVLPFPRTKTYSFPKRFSGTGWSIPASLFDAPTWRPKFIDPLLITIFLSETIDAPIQPSSCACVGALPMYVS